MKKLILVVVVLIVVAAIGLPPVIGSMAESSFRANIEQMDANPMFAMRVDDYERGWFSASTAVEVGFDERYAELMMAGGNEDTDLAAVLRDQAITIPVDIAHGPIVFTDGLYFGLARIHAILDERDELAASMMEELGLDYLAQLHGQVSYLGTFSFSSDVPPVEYVDEQGQLSFSGLNLDGVTRGSNLELDGEMENLVIDSGGTAVTVDSLYLVSDSNRINQVLWEGEFDSGIESLSIVDTLAGSAGAMAFTDLRAFGSTELDPTGELIAIDATYSAARIRIPAEDVVMTDVNLTMLLENISVDGFTEYYETMLNIDPQNPDATAMAMQAIMFRLLEQNPAITFDPVRFTLNDESLNAAASLRTVNGEQASLDIGNPFALLGLFEASASVDASKPLFERLAAEASAAQMGMIDPEQVPPGQDLESMAQAQADLTIALLVGQGYLIDDGENYSTEIEYANGEVRVNGEPLPLGALLQ
jgi:uncharacterized protein YdgA (DUF945 family)